MISTLRLPVLALPIAIVVAIVAIVSWYLNRPLPEVRTPPIDEAGESLADELTDYQRAVHRRLAELSIKSVSPQANEVCRLILLPTFDEPVIIRVTNTGDRIELTKKIFDGVGGYGLNEMGKVADDQKLELSLEDFQRMRELLDAAEVWRLPVRDPNDEPVTDGALWFLDIRDEGATRSIVRITPGERLLRLFRYILRLAGLEDHYRGYWPD